MDYYSPDTFIKITDFLDNITRIIINWVVSLELYLSYNKQEAITKAEEFHNNQIEYNFNMCNNTINNINNNIKKLIITK